MHLPSISPVSAAAMFVTGSSLTDPAPRQDSTASARRQTVNAGTIRRLGVPILVDC